MLRPYSPDDLQACLAMVKKSDNTPAASVQERLDTWTTLVWEDSDVVLGTVLYQKEEEGEFNIRLWVDPSCHDPAVRPTLCEAGLQGVASFGERGRITTRYRVDEGNAQAFFRHAGFNYWYGMDSLAYRGSKMLVRGDIDVRPYEDRHYDEFIRVRAEAFYPQRRFFDFRPHDVRLDGTPDEKRKQAHTCRDSIFLAFENGRLVGEAELEDNFIGTLSVDPEIQSRGYGKALMQTCLNATLDRGYGVVETSVVLGNIAAWRLYNVLGLKRTQTDEWACMWI